MSEKRIVSWIDKALDDMHAKDAAFEDAQAALTRPQRIKAIKRRLTERTPGKWRACHNGECPCGMVWAIDEDVPVHVAATFDDADMIVGTEGVKANARFIQHAPEDIQFLLDELARVKALLKAEKDKAEFRRRME